MIHNEYFLPAATLISAVLTSVLLRFLIPVLKSKKMGQKILDIGPRWHKDKEGTPTMGGISFITASVLTAAVFLAAFYRESGNPAGFLLSIAYAIATGLVGVTDDICKLKKKKNEGLSAGQKYLLQLICASLYLIFMKRLGCISEELYIPFAQLRVDSGWWFYLICILLLTGFNNAVNLTDGIDGLCASATAAVSLTFLALSISTGYPLFSLFCTVILGGCLGFLVYNLHPAKVFMGDTGSLFLGGAVGAMSVMLGKPLLLLIPGAVYVIETASVIIQVIYFKLTGRRFFKMAPFHHHLEKCGWTENRITFSAVLLTLLLGAVCYIFA